MPRFSGGVLKEGPDDIDFDEGNFFDTPRTKGKLDWRDNPATNFSDWTIIVQAETVSCTTVDTASTESNQPEEVKQADRTNEIGDMTFHVHKNILSFGERASVYFSTQFSLAHDTIETQSSTTKLKLPAICVNCVPAFLDFMYYGSLELSPSTVIPLIELARRLEVPALGQQATRYVKDALHSCNGECTAQIPKILADAMDLRMEKVQAAALKAVTTQFEIFPVESLSWLPFNLMVEILNNDDLNIASEDKVYDVIVHYLADNAKLSESQCREIWAGLRFAFLTFSKQKEALGQKSLPRDVLFEDAIACIGIRIGSSERQEILPAVSSDCACRLKPRGVKVRVAKLSINQCYGKAHAQNTLESVMDGCFETGVCATAGYYGSTILIKFTSIVYINKFCVAGYYGSTITWNPNNGKGATIEFSLDGETYTQCGCIPSNFGCSKELCDVPLTQRVHAMYVRFKHNSYIGLSQIVF